MHFSLKLQNDNEQTINYRWPNLPFSNKDSKTQTQNTSHVNRTLWLKSSLSLLVSKQKEACNLFAWV